MAVVDTTLNDLPDKVARMLADAALAETYLRCSFDWNGSTIPCVVTKQWQGKEFDVSGWVRRRKCKLKYRTPELPDSLDRPGENDRIAVRSSENGVPIQYRIKSFEVWFDAIIELYCEEDMQRLP